jgi:hypothetical protein
MAGKQLLPFRSGTRQKYYQMNPMTYGAGQTLTQIFPQTGMLSMLFLQVVGTITYSAPGALSDKGPWNLLSRIQIITNIGSAVLVDLSGFGAYLVQQLIGSGNYRPDTAGAGSTTPSSLVYAFPLSGTAQAFRLSYIIPIAANDGINFDTGLINLQAPQTQVTLSVQCGQLLDPATLVTAIVATINVGYWYYEVPDLSTFMLPSQSLVRTLETNLIIGTTGEQPYTLPQMGTILQNINVLTLNGARSDSMDYGFVRFNKSDTIYNIPLGMQRMLERQRYGLNPIVGTFFWDFWHAYGQVSEGDVRDAIDSEAIATLDIGVAVSSGASLGSNNNSMTTISRLVQTIQVAR